MGDRAVGVSTEAEARHRGSRSIPVRPGPAARTRLPLPAWSSQTAGPAMHATDNRPAWMLRMCGEQSAPGE